MPEKYLDIHLEGEYEKAEGLKRILDQGIPCAVSIIPHRLKLGLYSDKLLQIAEEIITKNNGILGQHGNKHRCPYDLQHTIADGAHENFCFYHKIGYNEQLDFMGEGKETLISRFGFDPKLYGAPNHLFNKESLQAASELGYVFFAERSWINADAYLIGNLLILPECKITGKGDICYIHYNELVENPKALERFEGQFTSFSQIKPIPLSEWEYSLNHHAVKLAKVLRDAVNLVRTLDN
jgi:hypothetical protein